jgi:2'-5' RNA ligase
LRLFVAINLPASVRDAVYADAGPLRSVAPRVKWVAPASLHVTLKFLGSQDDAMLPALERALADVASRHAAVDVETRRLGAFPNFRRPRVVWVGMTGAGALGGIARDVDRSLASLGIPSETRPFRAHLTLGRVKDDMTPSDAQALADVAGAGVPPRGFAIRTIDLMQSELGPGGSKYSVVAAVPLHARGT